MFEYDEAKSRANALRHGLTFAEAQELWTHPTLEILARAGGEGEQRFAVIGGLRAGIWTAIITYRGPVRRVMSIRRARPDKVRLYEQEELRRSA